MVPMICGRPVGSTVLARKMLNRREPSGSFAPEALALFAAKPACWLCCSEEVREGRDDSTVSVATLKPNLR